MHPITPGPVASPSSARVRAALLATPADYLALCLAQRVDGPSACGSVFLGAHTPAELLAALNSADWQPYEHSAVMKGCTAFRAPLRGLFGLQNLAVLSAPTLRVMVTLSDPKGTGYVEATVSGVRGVEVDFAVAILGPDSGREVCYTFHPGDPIPPSQVAAVNMHGRTVTPAEALVLGLCWAKIVAPA